MRPQSFFVQNKSSAGFCRKLSGVAGKDGTMALSKRGERSKNFPVEMNRFARRYFANAYDKETNPQVRVFRGRFRGHGLGPPGPQKNAFHFVVRTCIFSCFRTHNQIFFRFDVGSTKAVGPQPHPLNPCFVQCSTQAILHGLLKMIIFIGSKPAA